jgi:hypothetical protein
MEFKINRQKNVHKAYKLWTNASGWEAFSEAPNYFCLSDTLRGFSAELSS